MAWRVEISEVREEPRQAQEWRKLHDTPEPGQYGYVDPAPGATQVVEAKVYEQMVHEMDIQKVILAVNGIGAAS